jgi:hypothetical protein
MILAHPPDAETNLAVRVDHGTSLTGWCRYASIAQFERTSLCRSPHLTLLMISSSKKLADQFGSPSSPVLSRTLQAIWKDCSISSVSVMRGERLRSCHVPRARGDQTRKLIRVSMTKARTGITKNPTRNVGLIANILLGSIMRIVDQHPPAPSAHKVTEEQNGWTGTSRVASEPSSSFRIDVNWRCACRTS